MINLLESLLKIVTPRPGNPLGSGFKPPTPLVAGDPLTALESILSKIVGGMTTLAGIFFIVYFVQAAFQWVTSGGDKGKLEAARGKMVNGVLGMIMIATSLTIISLVGYVLGLRILEPAAVLNSLKP